jgi:hypothetical protein
MVYMLVSRGVLFIGSRKAGKITPASVIFFYIAIFANKFVSPLAGAHEEVLEWLNRGNPCQWPSSPVGWKRPIALKVVENQPP